MTGQPSGWEARFYSGGGQPPSPHWRRAVCGPSNNFII